MGVCQNKSHLAPESSSRAISIISSHVGQTEASSFVISLEVSKADLTSRGRRPQQCEVAKAGAEKGPWIALTSSCLVASNVDQDEVHITASEAGTCIAPEDAPQGRRCFVGTRQKPFTLPTDEIITTEAHNCDNVFMLSRTSTDAETQKLNEETCESS